MGEEVDIGPNTTVPASEYETINFANPRRAVQDLLETVFGRETLRTHSLSGRPSNAFKGIPAKPQLNPKNVADIIQHVYVKTGHSLAQRLFTQGLQIGGAIHLCWCAN